MELTDAQIVEKIKRRDVAGYEYILDKYSKQIYYLAYNILHISCAKEDIEECVSDVFLEAWTGVDRYDAQKGAFRTWLFILTKYKALAYKRRLDKPATINLEDVEPVDAEDVEKRLISRQAQEQVIEIIDGFNATDRELFIRRYFYGEKINDLAKALNLTRAAIDNRLLRGRKLIREVLSYE